MNPPFAVQKIGHAVINVADLGEVQALLYRCAGLQGVRHLCSTTRCRAAWCSCAATAITIAWRWSAACRPEARPSGRCTTGLRACHAGRGVPCPRSPEEHGAKSSSKAAAAPAARSRSSSSIPTAIISNSTGASTRSAMTAARGRPRNGGRRRAWRTPCASRRPARTRRCTTPRCATASARAPTGHDAAAFSSACRSGRFGWPRRPGRRASPANRSIWSCPSRRAARPTFWRARSRPGCRSRLARA